MESINAVRIQRLAYDILYYVFWIAEVMLFLSLLLKLLGANPSSRVVAFFHSVAASLAGPFQNIFPSVAIEGNMILDISLLAAMVFYAILAYAVVAFLRILIRS